MWNYSNKKTSSYAICFLIFCIIIRIIWLIFNRWPNWDDVNDGIISEKVEMCSGYYNDFQQKINDEKYKWNYIKVWGIEMFYNKKLDTCVWTYWIQRGDSSGNFNTSYFIIDYLNWDKQLFNCESSYLKADITTLDDDFNCLDKFRSKRDKYKK